MPTIRQLNQRHSDADEAEAERLYALYLGGKRFKAQLHEFLPQRPQEPAQVWELRKKESHYQNYIGPIIDYFASMLFTSRPIPGARRKGQEDTEADPGEYYTAFRGDCDRRGTDIDALFHQQFTAAMVQGCAWIRAHQPFGSSDELSLAEYQLQGFGDCWLEALSHKEVLDWETDDAGNLEWAIVRYETLKRTGPGDERSSVTVTWDYLTADTVTTYRIDYQKNKVPPDSTEVPVVAEEHHRFGQVPLFCIDLPPGLWIANRLASPQLAHFRASNAQDWGMSRTCYAMPVYKVNDPEQFDARMGSGYGITIEPTEDVTWIAPPGDHFEALENRIKSHKDEIFRIGHQMALGVDNNSAAVGRTAESKAMDAQTARVVLLAFSKAVKEAMARVYNAIAAARGDDLEWSVTGLDEFASTDITSFLDALTKTKEWGVVPSKTALVQIWIKLLDALMPELDEKTKSIIKEEVLAKTPEPDPTMTPEMQLIQLTHEVKSESASGGSGSGDGESEPLTNGPGTRKTGGRKPPKASSN